MSIKIEKVQFHYIHIPAPWSWSRGAGDDAFSDPPCSPDRDVALAGEWRRDGVDQGAGGKKRTMLRCAPLQLFQLYCCSLACRSARVVSCMRKCSLLGQQRDSYWRRHVDITLKETGNGQTKTKPFICTFWTRIKYFLYIGNSEPRFD